MKKAICTILAVLMLTALFAGCGGEPEPLKICVDIDMQLYLPSDDTVRIFAEAITMLGGPEDIELEILPAEEEVRSAAVQRIRTEMMAGKGPDVFIVLSSGGMNGYESLFPVPEKAMENHLFLPLDEYLENAQFMEWDKQTKVIMDAGRNEYGQQILPLTYTMPITFYRTEDIGNIKPGPETTWQDMLEDETGVLSTAGTWFHMDQNAFSMSTGYYLENILGPMADYKEDKLLFTEEELLQRATEILDLKEAYDAGVYADVPTHFQTRFSTGYQSVENGDWSLDVCRGIRHEEPQTMIPIYSDDGGVTATVMSFAAVNANTKRPEDAFFVLDYLLSRSCQRYSDLYKHWLAPLGYAIPVQADLMQEDPNHEQYSVMHWYMSAENYAEFSRVRDQITHVRFNGGLDEPFGPMMYECFKAHKNGENIAPIIEEYYNILKQVIAE